MSLNSYLLLAAIAVCCFTTHMAFPMDGFANNNKCQCLATTSAVIPPRLFQKIEILPAGAHCRKIEILITKKDNKTVCINPEARWIKNIISKVMRSKRAVKKTSVPTAA
ncbi:alveolar macrophage chemotactic factor [Siphateles boraxobius]|uniref:alveolar macrophage chemotactic factor n=1 Tax=Siphateles boraxobius TaxID=180520 RepID=UPI004063AD8F